MADQLQSYDERGPLIYLGPVNMWLMHDPLGIGKEERHDFSLPLWQLWATESSFIAKAGSAVLKEESSFNDYFGFGTSRDEAISEAAEFCKKVTGSTIEVTVQTKVIAKPTVHDGRKAPFYSKSVKCFAVPQWRWKVANGKPITEAVGAEAEFCTWRNGASTDEAAHLQTLIDRIKAADGAEAIRKASHG